MKKTLLAIPGLKMKRGHKLWRTGGLGKLQQASLPDPSEREAVLPMPRFSPVRPSPTSGQQNCKINCVV